MRRPSASAKGTPKWRRARRVSESIPLSPSASQARGAIFPFGRYPSLHHAKAERDVTMHRERSLFLLLLVLGAPTLRAQGPRLVPAMAERLVGSPMRVSTSATIVQASQHPSATAIGAVLGTVTGVGIVLYEIHKCASSAETKNGPC